MFLVSIPDTDPVSRSFLIAWRAQQLQKHQEDIDTICKQVLLSWFASLQQFKTQFKNQIRDFNSNPGNLILVWNTQIEKELNQKMKPRYLGPMMVLHQTTGGSYLLAELDGAISKLWYAAFQLLSYYPRTKISIPVMDLTKLGNEELDNYEAKEDVEYNENKDKGDSDN